MALVQRIYDDEFAIAAVLLARIGPALLFSPIAGVLGDRWDRKKVMVFSDVARASLILILPFVETVTRGIPLLTPVLLLFIVSGLLEMLTLLWQPAKDATVPDMVEDSRHYTHAYSLLLMAAYATFPLSGAVFGLLAKASVALGEAAGLQEFALNPEHLALFLDAITFLVSAGLTMTLRIAPRRGESKEPLSFRAGWEDLVTGVRFLVGHQMIRPWVLGIGGAFAGIGTFITMAPIFVADVLGGGSGSFGLLVAAVGVGLGSGFLLAGPTAQLIPKDIILSTVVVAMGFSTVAFGSVSTLTSALVLASLCGVFAGFAYPSGYALIQEKLEPSLRGRGSAAVNSIIRLAIVGASAVAPVVVKVVDRAAPGSVGFSEMRIEILGLRVAMWLGGTLIVVAGLVTTKAIGVRRRQRPAGSGLFLVFEGSDGSGKTTQMQLLEQYLAQRGHRVVVSQEPGGTRMGEKIRDLLLDPDHEELCGKAEALLYAADRAQHVEEVIMPALESGAIVISDRYVDSSVAYQGIVRGVGADHVRAVNRWGTSGLIPDMVFLLDVDVEKSWARSGREDRIESEGVDFQRRVQGAYRLLAERHSGRFVVVDGSHSPEAIAAEIRRTVDMLLTTQESVPELKPEVAT